MSRAAHTFAKRALALVIGFVASTIGLEVFYRVIRAPGLGPTTNPAYVVHDSDLGWSYRPGARERHRTNEFDVSIEINARGFRGREWTAKSTGRPRVLVLGDSFAFGWGVEEAQSFSSLLQARAPEWEILNAAVSGYGTDQRYLLLQKLLPEVKPDLVIDVFCSNDRFESASDTSYGKPKPYFVRGASGLELRGVPVMEPWLERTSYFYRAVAKELAERSSAARRPDPNREWVLVCDIYRAMRDHLGDVPLVIVSTEQRLVNFATEETSIHHIDLRPVLAKIQEPVTFPIDGHWTPIAHAAIADALASALRPLMP